MTKLINGIISTKDRNQVCREVFKELEGLTIYNVVLILTYILRRIADEIEDEAERDALLETINRRLKVSTKKDASACY